jgi:hypothetical protein
MIEADKQTLLAEMGGGSYRRGAGWGNGLAVTNRDAPMDVWL